MQGIFWHKIHRPLEVKSEGFAGLALRHVLASAASPFDTNSAAFDRRDIRHAPSRRTSWPRNSHGHDCRDDEQTSQGELRAGHLGYSLAVRGYAARSFSRFAACLNDSVSKRWRRFSARTFRSNSITSRNTYRSIRIRCNSAPPKKAQTMSDIQIAVLNRN